MMMLAAYLLLPIFGVFLAANERQTSAFSPPCGSSVSLRQQKIHRSSFVPPDTKCIFRHPYVVKKGLAPVRSFVVASSSMLTDQAINGEQPSDGDGLIKNETKSGSAPLNAFQSALVKTGMLLFLLSMCIALPLTLFPQELLYRLKLISKKRKEYWALLTGQFCSRWLLRLIPFCRLSVKTDFENAKTGEKGSEPEPAIWVCNHTSMLDVFLLMATDKRMRGKHGRRPIKVVYWDQLEANPISKLLFRQSGFISVKMAANKAGEDNSYDRASFKKLLKDSKEAFADGFDLGIMPEGQLNPSPEKGLLPVFSGAYTLAKIAKRPIYMMALSGAHQLWHPNEEIGMKPTGRQIKVRCYGQGRQYNSPEDFLQTFENVVGTFGLTGEDLPEDELESWMDGTKVSQQETDNNKDSSAKD